MRINTIISELTQANPKLSSDQITQLAIAQLHSESESVPSTVQTVHTSPQPNQPNLTQQPNQLDLNSLLMFKLMSSMF